MELTCSPQMSPILGKLDTLSERINRNVNFDLPDLESLCCSMEEPAGSWAMSRSLLNIEKRSLLRLMLSSDGLASKDAV